MAPVSDETLQSLNVGIQATPLATPAESTSALSLFPNSEPAESASRQQIEALERELVACWNGGDWRRIAAFFTRSFLARAVAESGDPIDEFLPPEPDPLDPLDWESVLVRDVRRVDAGRLAAVVNFCGYAEVHYYRQEDQEWRIDDITDVDIVEGTVICEMGPIMTVTPGP